MSQYVSDKGSGSRHTRSVWTALGGDSQTTRPIILTKSVSLLQTFDIHFRRLVWVYCPGYAGVEGTERAERLVDKATIVSG